MKRLFADMSAFLLAIGKNIVTLMSGIFSVIVWALGACLEPMPLSLRWTFLVFGTIGLLGACFLAWRAEHRARLNENARLKLLRMIDNGEHLIARCEPTTHPLAKMYREPTTHRSLEG